jgi:hypothetical protein
MVRPLAAVLFVLLTTCAAPPEEPAPAAGPVIPFKDWARRAAGRESLDAVDLVPALRQIVRDHRDSPEQILRRAYFLLSLWPDGASWDAVRTALLRDGVLNAQQWLTGDSEKRRYRIEFTVQPAAWKSPGGHSYDLVVAADVQYDVAQGHRSWAAVKEPEAFLQAAIGLEQRDAVRSGNYPAGSIFSQAMEGGAESFGKQLSFVTSIRAQYRVLFNRWVELSSFGFHFRTEFVDHPVAEFNTASQSFYSPSSLDPPIDWKQKLHPGREEEVFNPMRGPWGGSGSSIGDGHAFVRIDAGGPPKDGC